MKHPINPTTTKAIIDALKAKTATVCNYPPERVYVVTDNSRRLIDDPPADRYAAISLLGGSAISSQHTGSGEELYAFEASLRIRQFKRLEVDVDGDEYQSLFGDTGLLVDMNKVLQKEESGGLMLWTMPDGEDVPLVLEPIRVLRFESPNRNADSPIAICWTAWQVKYVQTSTVL